MDKKVKDAQNLEECFDVVDLEDQVLTQATRREVHAKELRHRAVHVFVFNAAGEVFLQRRSLHKDSAPGLWSSSCAGHLDAGEAYDAAASRELREELGLAPPVPPVRCLRLEACAQTTWEFLWIYRLEAEGPFLLDPAEIEEGAWFAPAQVDREVLEGPERFAESFRYVWQKLRTGLRTDPELSPP